MIMETINMLVNGKMIKKQEKEYIFMILNLRKKQKLILESGVKEKEKEMVST